MKSIPRILKQHWGKIVLILLFVLLCVNSVKKGGDFDVYLHAANKLSNGENIYVPPFLDGLNYYYSVFFAMLLIPFVNFPFTVELIWSLGSLVFLYRSFLLAQAYLPMEGWTEKRKTIFGIVLLVLGFQFIQYNILMIQITLFLLWGILESVRQIEKGNHILAGLLLALIINIKVMPILVLPYLLYRGHIKAFAWTVGLFFVLLYLPAVYVGWDENNFLLTEWWKIINPSNKEHVFEVEIGGHSLSALIPVLLTDTEILFSSKRNFIDLPEGTVEFILNVVRLALVGLTLFFLRSLPFKEEKSPLKKFWELSYIVFLIPLILPHQQKYAFVLCLPLVMYLLFYFFEKRKQGYSTGDKVALGIFALAMLNYSPLYGRDIIGRFLFEWTQYYRFLTFSSLLLIPVAMYCRPNQLQQV